VIADLKALLEMNDKLNPENILTANDILDAAIWGTADEIKAPFKGAFKGAFKAGRDTNDWRGFDALYCEIHVWLKLAYADR
jgi:hypothetical protein